MDRGMAILVTGGAGYVGSHTVRLLAAQGRDVIVLDNLERGHRAAVLDVPFVPGDVRDIDLVRRVIAEHGVDAVVHFAAYKAPEESVRFPGLYFDNNVGVSARLLRVAEEAECAASSSRRPVRSTGRPHHSPVSEAAEPPPGEPVRREQADGRDDAGGNSTVLRACARSRCGTSTPPARPLDADRRGLVRAPPTSSRWR